MANTLAPFGFSPSGTISGSGPNFRLSQRKIASTYTTAIYTGDAVMPVTTTATGYIIQYATGTVPCCGVFLGCVYLSVSQSRIVRSEFWPGSDANGDVTCYVIDNPDAMFLVQSGYTGGAVTLANVNQNASIIATPVGSNLTGRSGMALGQAATTSTYPFTIVGLAQDLGAGNGTDITTAFNYVYVTFNNEIFRTGNTSIS